MSIYHDYMERLRAGLKSLPAERREEILADIESYFTEGLADGADEEKLCAMLGAPEALAKEYIAGHAVEEASDNPTPRKVLRAIWAGVGVGFLNLFIMFWVWLTAAFVWFAVALLAVSCTLGGAVAAVLAAIAWVYPAIPVFVDFPALYVFGGVSMAAFGGLCSVLAIGLLKKLGKGIVRYVKMNVELVTGKRRERSVGGND